jgi:hypothetical protein
MVKKFVLAILPENLSDIIKKFEPQFRYESFAKDTACILDYISITFHWEKQS